LHVSHLTDVVINDEVLETIRNIACLDPDTPRSSSLWLNQIFLLLVMMRLLLWDGLK
jgi:hypothetical protein